MIELRHVRKEYEIGAPIEDVSAVIHDGEVVSIIGPSGTGKTTLLKMINMLEKPTSGQIFVDGEEVTAPDYPLNKLRMKVSMVFQNFNLFNNMTVIENVCCAPIDLKEKDPSAMYDEGMRLLETVGMKKFAMKYPDRLSGGQKQRVAIARSLAMEPKYILFDEPTSALDPIMVDEVGKEIKKLRDEGYTIVLVTHDMHFAKDVSTRVLYLRNGRIWADGTPEQIFRYMKEEDTEEEKNRMIKIV